jgi:5-methylcytosine-specific restriction endonuclease McrA
MKSIEITGKRTLDKLHKIKTPPRRRITEKWQLDDTYFVHERQIQLINQLYLEEDIYIKYTTDNNNNEDIKVKTIMKREITSKINGYKHQDIQKGILDELNIISLEQTIERLMESKIQCCYCKEHCLLLYKESLSKKQWTLDRIVNNKGHNYDNVVICCLECNVKRGDMDSERFKRGKEIKFVRKLF